AYGGLQFIRFNADGSVFVDPVICARDTYRELNQRLLLFFTGQTRHARDVLARQQEQTADHLDVLAELSGLALEMRNLLSPSGDLDGFGRLLDCAWRAKKRLEASITNGCVDDIYDRGIEAGALGGKLLGAGNGGFVLFYCPPERQDALCAALSSFTRVPFAMEPEGSKIAYLGGERL
ncbi:MAG TPA: hypothetical protein VN428_16590, partial [Bryobacteraceae bacterium]|nr:hypothetical protein [Bryobacteraceae bacterium]